MRRFILLIAVVLFYVACNQNSVPKGIIEKDKMLNVLLDMQLTDAALNQVYNNDTMKMQAHSRYNYLFAKYKIDSATFTNSLKYYSRNAAELDTMYAQVSDSLIRFQKKLMSNKLKSVNHGEELYKYISKKFMMDTAKFNMDYYSLDAKKLYAKYTKSLDSLKHLKDSIKLDGSKHLQDSIKPKPKKVEEIKKLK